MAYRWPTTLLKGEMFLRTMPTQSKESIDLVDKQTFLAGAICRTRGWYYHNAPELSPGPGLQWRFYVGAEVGRRARAFLGSGKYLPRSPVEKAIEASADAISNNDLSLLFEVTFSADGLIARADALRRRSENAWTLLEIKSGKSGEFGEAKQEYVDDIAYTLCVARKAGLEIEGATLVLLNRDYRMGGAAPMFVEIDVTAQASVRANELAAIVPEVVTAALSDTRPDPSLKFCCKDCDHFATECVGLGIDDHIFLLPRLSEKKFTELRAFERIARLPASAKLTENQKRVAEIIASGQQRMDGEQLRSYLNEVIWPAYYLDFEAVLPALPWFEGSPPYEAVPFQYSIHVRDAATAEVTHREYLAPVESDWRRALTEQLLSDLGSEGSILVYSSYEKTRITALAASFPDLSDALLALIPRLFDLERIFKDAYSHPGFLGRTSIKTVLPVLVPGLSYSTLPVNNGDDALGVFGLMRVGEYAEELHDGYRTQLLEYCKLDTTAMVRLHEAVIGLAGS